MLLEELIKEEGGLENRPEVAALPMLLVEEVMEMLPVVDPRVSEAVARVELPLPLLLLSLERLLSDMAIDYCFLFRGFKNCLE